MLGQDVKLVFTRPEGLVSLNVYSVTVYFRHCGGGYLPHASAVWSWSVDIQAGLLPCKGRRLSLNWALSSEVKAIVEMHILVGEEPARWPTDSDTIDTYVLYVFTIERHLADYQESELIQFDTSLNKGRYFSSLVNNGRLNMVARGPVIGGEVKEAILQFLADREPHTKWVWSVTDDKERSWVS